ncbi:MULTISPECIES: tRNA (adenosine(37)-N6)-threonylcarbamoyltransferase complex dimerization subunit type 1 TsaB [Prochlorococcus]|uniref:Inactive similar to metal-dependent protease n=1 Tax=Prochlorococcus marinus (strain SARG / CCMP1375 / SS120) TaxID=167539 RepID=Q7VE51_PROMA|nr:MULTISPECIES: tRNA (adenosine(37)-N6)-threonylcarbamoyltransferase complex dimerization subunit type 1 TsaB [Prochlorococcus]AAP99208.1 Inactive similar to metal-dependent protease [Prochlorococcus marinus subsp. marinus str. CCMP1375]KGG11524.1 inactive metal-dependent protease [Prochlorococcus marinus str. LG]KGG18522.1 inactive metal-dependent protease [Prochlorococcus marinus str. SS2]KGG22795.1 inactive metal-dependent protease [Prochlorococcus marinus str. SS35]KGG32672.1 inactive met
MKIIGQSKTFSKDEKFLLAFHSTTEKLGIGLIELNNEKPIFNSSIFDVGRGLSKELFNCIETILPINYWYQIERLAVATGPGSFTSTRVTIVLARTIAQQLNCSIDGISSFELMAYRLALETHIKEDTKKSFWITQPLKRRGTVAGKYEVIKSDENINNIKIKELKSPYLLSKEMEVTPAINASENVQIDIKTLLRISLDSYKNNIKSNWEEILPIYPTSPVE